MYGIFGGMDTIDLRTAARALADIVDALPPPPPVTVHLGAGFGEDWYIVGNRLVTLPADPEDRE